jgi:Mg2+/citrate symporter
VSISPQAKSEPPTDAEIERRKRLVAWLGAVLALAGVIGLIVDRSLLVLWVFMIAFGIAKLPKAIYDRIRERAR